MRGTPEPCARTADGELPTACELSYRRLTRCSDFFLTAEDSPERTFNHSHSIINKTPKPAWLKGMAVIDMGPYRRFYRQKRRSFAGAGDGEICGEATFSTSLSIRHKHIRPANALDHRSPSCCKRTSSRLTAQGGRTSGPQFLPATKIDTSFAGCTGSEVSATCAACQMDSRVPASNAPWHTDRKPKNEHHPIDASASYRRGKSADADSYT